MKFFLVGETHPQLTGHRLFIEAVNEQEARDKFYKLIPAMRGRPGWLVKVKEITEKEFRERRVA